MLGLESDILAGDCGKLGQALGLMVVLSLHVLSMLMVSRTLVWNGLAFLRIESVSQPWILILTRSLSFLGTRRFKEVLEIGCESNL